jgi:cytochrome c-type biogenesis protein CcmH/NrfF
VTLLFAHAGHWITGLVYAAPVLLIVIALAVTTVRERRRRARDERVTHS